MNSLRSRLILGSGLIAIVPLALAMLLLSRRIEGMVRSQAAERLTAELTGLQAQLAADEAGIRERLRILARDPVLKRLYLLQPSGSRELSDYLEERRVLLGLDRLAIADASGSVVGEATAAAASDTLPALAMAASAPIRYESQEAGTVRGGLVIDAPFLTRLKRTAGMDLILRDGAGRIVATTVEARGAPAGPPSGALARVELASGVYLGRTLALAISELPHATITGLVATAPADRTIAALRATSLLLALLGLGVAIALSVLWSSQVSRPVERLAAYSSRLARGEWDEPLALRSVGELRALVEALDRMRLDLRAYRDRLRVSERQAAWSQMAREVAHEVTNPLTPIAVSVADLKRSFDQKRPDFPEILDRAVRTVGEEVETLRRLLQEFSDFARLPAPRPSPCRITGLFADLETLYGREVAEGRLALVRPEPDIAFSADPGQIRQALVNLVKNGLESREGGARVSVSASEGDGAIEIAVADSGPGLSPERRAQIFVPGFTTKSQGSGLGLTVVERIANDHRGTITVDAGTTGGTTFRLRLPLS